MQSRTASRAQRAAQSADTPDRHVAQCISQFGGVSQGRSLLTPLRQGKSALICSCQTDGDGQRRVGSGVAAVRGSREMRS